MKKTVSAILAVILMVCTLLAVPVSAASISDFTDVKPGAWYYDAVEYAVEKGLFNGTSATTFSPGQSMTRGMFVTVLGNLHGVDKAYGQDRQSPFADVSKTAWYYPAAVWASENGVASGTGSGFSPNGNVTREQMAVMLYNYFVKFGNLTLAEKDSAYASFPDCNKVSGYARTAMQWAVKYSVISGSDGRLAPQGNATRAQVAQVLLNFSKLEQFAVSQPTTSPEPTVTPEPTSTPAPTSSPAPSNLTWKDWHKHPVGWSDSTHPEHDIWAKVNAEWQEVRWNYSVQYDLPTGKSEPDADGGYYDYDLANEIMKQINDIRDEFRDIYGENREPLLWSPRVQGWADIRAKECSVVWGHTRPDGSSCLTVGNNEVNAENIMIEQNADILYFSGRMNTQEYAAEFAQAWYNSSGHQQNMLSPSLKIAAVSCYVKDGNVYACHLFSNKYQFYFDWEYPFQYGTNDPYDP